MWHVRGAQLKGRDGGWWWRQTFSPKGKSRDQTWGKPGFRSRLVKPSQDCRMWPSKGKYPEGPSLNNATQNLGLRSSHMTYNQVWLLSHETEDVIQSHWAQGKLPAERCHEQRHKQEVGISNLRLWTQAAMWTCRASPIIGKMQPKLSLGMRVWALTGWIWPSPH